MLQRKPLQFRSSSRRKRLRFFYQIDQSADVKECNHSQRSRSARSVSSSCFLLRVPVSKRYST